MSSTEGSTSDSSESGQTEHPESKRIKVDEQDQSKAVTDPKTTPASSASAANSSSSDEDDFDYDSLLDYDEQDDYVLADNVAGEKIEETVNQTTKPVKNAMDEYPFTVLSMQDVSQHMNEVVLEASNVLQLAPHTMRMLLDHFNWDKEKLLDTFYEKGEEELFKSAHIVVPHKAVQPALVSSDKKEDCPVCFEETASSDMFGLPCGHRFCRTCWISHITSKITTEGAAQAISCPQLNCDTIVDEVTVKELITEPKVMEKYQYLLASNFVECNRLVRWCPAAGCMKAIKVQWIANKPVTCSCGYVFCFQCGHDWHDPTPCDLLKKWVKRCADDSETSRWLRAYTKDCPKCHVQIEKNGGCNHMTCRNASCKYEFCWICLGKWPHSSSACNRFDPGKQKDVEQSRAELHRYLFYCDRYMNHFKSLKLENRLYATVETKMATLQANKMSWIESQYLKNAVDTLVRCRQTMMYTYSFAFYLKKTNQCMIFEDNQADLEQATEDLSEILENEDMSIEHLLKSKEKVQDKMSYCESRRQVLIKHVHEGYEEGWWLFMDP